MEGVQPGDRAGLFRGGRILFARDLNQALKVPVGIVLSAFGASTAEAWVPREAMAADPLLKPMLDKLDARYSYFKDHPGATRRRRSAAPQTINARPGRPGPLRDPCAGPASAHRAVQRHDQSAPSVRDSRRHLVPGRVHRRRDQAARCSTTTSWRPGHAVAQLWGEGNFPFYVVQLPGQQNVSNNPLVREEQAKILSLPNTGMAVVMDTSEAKNVHPAQQGAPGRPPDAESRWPTCTAGRSSTRARCMHR